MSCLNRQGFNGKFAAFSNRECAGSTNQARHAGARHFLKPTTENCSDQIASQPGEVLFGDRFYPETLRNRLA